MKSFVLLRYLVILTSLIAAPVANAETIALEGATIFASPELPAIANGVILISAQGIIALGKKGTVTIPDEAKRFDLSGQFISAGFWNSHVHHLFSRDMLEQNQRRKLQYLIDELFLRWGFVNVVDTGADLDLLLNLKKLIKTNEVQGPQILVMGGSFVGKGGTPFYVKPIQLPEFSSTDQAAAAVSDVLKAGADGIKLFTGSWATPEQVVLMELDHVKAATTIAHTAGSLVFAHPSDSEGASIAIEGGVDVLAHSFPAELKGPWNRALPAAMAKHSVALVPTLKVFRYDLERIKLPPNIVDLHEQNAIDQTGAVKKAGATILFGTDVGYMHDNDPSEEYRLMAKAGLNFRDILESLTTAPARVYGQAKRMGKIEAGFQADLVVMASDPRDNVSAFADINMTIKDGLVVYRR